MTAPDVHPTTELLHEALGPALTSGDDGDAALLGWLDGPGHLLGDVDDLVRDTPQRQGWAWVLDPDQCPLWALPWVANYTGNPDDPTLDEASRRLRQVEGPAEDRGTPRGIRAAVRVTLAGGRRVLIEERTAADGTADGAAYRVTTFTVETPDAAATAAAVVDSAPAGLRVRASHRVRAAATIAELAVAYPTIADLVAAFATVADVVAYLPPEPP